MKWKITIEHKPDKFMQHGETKVTEMCDAKLVEYFLREVLPHKVTHDAVKTVTIRVLDE